VWPSPRSPGPRCGSLTAFVRPEPINNRLWHIPFNRVNDKLTEELVRGREDIFFGYPEALRGSFGFCRAWDTTLAQNEQRRPGR
jgi:hypothetical protein